jgi:hypothetical protein
MAISDVGPSKVLYIPFAASPCPVFVGIIVILPNKNMSEKTKLLVVEDEFIEANNMSVILHEAGYIVLPLAASVPQALRILQQDPADLGSRSGFIYVGQ